MPPMLKIVQPIFATLQTFLTGGIIYGWSSVVVVMHKTGEYSELCDEAGNCEKREVQLNIIFSAASTAMLIGGPFWGWLLDKYGPRVCNLVAGTCFVIGAIGFAFSSSRGVDAYIPSACSMAAGGMGMFMCIFHLCNAIPKRSNLLLAIFDGAFDGSSVVLYFLQFFFENFGMSIRTFFLIIAAMGTIFVLLSIVVQPKTTYNTVGAEEHHDEEESNSNSNPEADSNEQEMSTIVSDVESGLNDKKQDRIQLLDGDDNDDDDQHHLHNSDNKKKPNDIKEKHDNVKVPCKLINYPFKKQLTSPIYLVTFVYYSLQLLRLNFNFGTIERQLDFMVGPEKSPRYVEIFNLIVPFGMTAVPPFGQLFDTKGSLVAISFLQGWSILYNAISLIPWIPIQFVGFFAFSAFRGMHFTATISFLVEKFGFKHFGKLLGFMQILGGFIQFLQAPILAAALTIGGGDFTVPNIAMLLLGFIAAIFPCFVYYSKKNLEK